MNGTTHSEIGVIHGVQMIAFVDAVMGNDDALLDRERGALRAVLSDAEFVDVCALIGAFNVVTRIADATGIPLDGPVAMMSTDVQQQLNLQRFASSANSQ